MKHYDRKQSIISVEELLRKRHTFISLEEALKDVDPPEWSEDVLSGKTKVIVGLPECPQIPEIRKNTERELYSFD